MRYIISLLLTSTAALAQVPSVVTDIPPVHSLVAAVMGDLGDPVLLLDRGASPHVFQLRPDQATAIAEADLVIWVGPDLTPWLDTALALRPEGAPVVGLMGVEGTHLQMFGAGAEAHDDHAEETGHDDHAAEAGHDDHAEEAGHDDHAAEAGHDDHAKEAGHDDHDHQGTDPHAWLDPGNGRFWLGVIAEELSRMDPENAATYTANAVAAVAAIDAAEAQALAALAPVKDRPFVTFHDAYGYFTAHFGLTQAGSVALGDASSPGARHLADLRATVAADTTICVYPEAQHDPKLVTQLAEDTGATVGGTLDPSGSFMEPGPALYPALIVALATTLSTCGE